MSKKKAGVRATMKVSRRVLAVRHAVSRDNFRYVLSRIKVTPEEVVATTGRLLIRMENDAEQDEGAKGEVLLKPSVVKFAKHMFGPPSRGLPIKLTVKEEKNEIEVDGWDGTAKLLLRTVELDEPRFPGCDQALPEPESMKPRFTMNVSLLQKILTAAEEAGVQALKFFADREGSQRKPVEIKGADEHDGFSAVLMPMVQYVEDELPPKSEAASPELRELFHRAWSNAHDSPYYDKEAWKELRMALQRAGVEV